MNIYETIDKLESTNHLTLAEYEEIITNYDDEVLQYVSGKALAIKKQHFQDIIYIRGLIEISNYCKNDCFYCGIRRSNKNIERYHLTKEEILNCCESGYSVGFRTFVLQGGEDLSFGTEKLVDIISDIKNRFPDCAVTLSIGEKTYDEYKAYFDAGADRYLLRHETACEELYKKLHPSEMSLKNRMKCLENLKEIGYQIGTGFMVGAPYQSANDLAKDMVYIQELKPHMVGIGPFIRHHDTIFRDEENGSVELTVLLTGLFRLMLPKSLLPATTALATLDQNGRIKAINAGANVIMPNLSPEDVRLNYNLYDNKACLGNEAASQIKILSDTLKEIGAQVVVDRGDAPDFLENMNV